MAMTTVSDDSFNFSATMRSPVSLAARIAIEAAGSMSAAGATGTSGAGTDRGRSIGGFAAPASRERLCLAGFGGPSLETALHPQAIDREHPTVFGCAPLAGETLCLKRQCVRAATIVELCCRIEQRDGSLAGVTARCCAHRLAFAHIPWCRKIPSRQRCSGWR